MFERFTTGSRHVVELATEEARRLGHGYLGTEHLLLGLLGEEHAAGRVLRSLGVDRERVRDEVVRIVRDGGPPATPDAEALETIGIDLDAVRRRVEETFGPGALERVRRRPAARPRRRFRRRTRCTHPADRGGTMLTPRAKKVLELALREALALRHRWIGPEHILLGLLREGEGLAALVLTRLGADLPTVRARLLQTLDGLADSG